VLGAERLSHGSPCPGCVVSLPVFMIAARLRVSIS